MDFAKALTTAFRKDRGLRLGRFATGLSRKGVHLNLLVETRSWQPSGVIDTGLEKVPISSLPENSITLYRILEETALSMPVVGNLSDALKRLWEAGNATRTAA